MADFIGVIIEESLNDKSVLSLVKITDTRIEPVTEHHATAWLNQWTIHTVAVSENTANNVAEKISQSLDPNHGSRKSGSDKSPVT